MNTEHIPEDYVLVHKTKAKISRARKMVIGMMAIGAVAALAGAGTFASFSASTTNDSTFQSGRLVLSNQKQGGTVCWSSGSGAGAGENDATLDSNETACDALFSSTLKPGDTATMGVTIRNESTSNIPGDLSLYALSACANEKNVSADSAGSANLCDGLKLYIKSTGSDFSSSPTCVFPSGGACDFSDPTSSVTDFMTAHGSFANRLSLVSALAVNTPKYYVIGVKFGTSGASGFTSTGVGIDNIYQNKKASLVLTWHLATS